MNFKDIKNFENLREYQIEKGKTHQNYRHYSNLEGVSGILNSGKLWLSNCWEMNDKQEIKKGSQEIKKKNIHCMFCLRP